MEKYGFWAFDGTGMSLLAQVKLFSVARQIIGTHGAALSNIVWSQQGVRVCEVFSSGYMPSCYSALTAMRGGQYTSASYAPGLQNIIDPASFQQLVSIARGQAEGN